MNKFNKHDDKFKYQLLSRLQMDCDFFLGYGNRNVKRLWSGDVKSHIKDMKTLYNSFPNNKKPQWISLKEIEEYEKNMLDNKICNKVKLENGEIITLVK